MFTRFDGPSCYSSVCIVFTRFADRPTVRQTERQTDGHPGHTIIQQTSSGVQKNPYFNIHDINTETDKYKSHLHVDSLNLHQADETHVIYVNYIFNGTVFYSSQEYESSKQC